MITFKYSLAKKGKIICSNCGRKTAVPYIETETGNVMSDFMRCDREEKCGYHKRPESSETIAIIQKEQIQKPTSYIPLQTLSSIFDKKENDHFTTYLLSLFPREIVLELVKKYLISSINRSTVFWQIDELERIRSGKIMLYNLTTGKRVKDENGKSHINWIHTYLKLQKFNLKQCLFGLHLIKENHESHIALFESEKTAIIMSVHMSNFLCLATGSNTGFKIEYLKNIKHRKIYAFPDKGQFELWQKTALQLNAFGYNIKVSDILENTEYNNGIDIADIYPSI